MADVPASEARLETLRMEQGDEQINAECDGDGETEHRLHGALLHPLGGGGVDNHRCEECEPEGEADKIQHGRLPNGRSRPKPRIVDIRDRLGISGLNIKKL